MLHISKVIGGININECKNDLRKDPQIIVKVHLVEFLDMLNQKYIYTDKIKMVVLDEADEILSYGFMECLYNIIRYFSKELKYFFF